MSNNNKIQIAVLEISSQNKAVLEFYFNGPGEGFYTLVDQQKADAFITDYDYPGAKDNLEQLLESSNKPAIVLSVKEQNITSTVWLAKPLSAAALTKTASELHQLIAANKESVAKALVIEDEEPEADVAKETMIEETAKVEVVNSNKADDFFEMLEEEELFDESQGEIAELLVAKTENLISAKSTAKIQAPVKASVNTTVNNSVRSDENSSLETPIETTASESEINSVEESLLDTLLKDDLTEEITANNISESINEDFDEISVETANLAFTDVVIEDQSTKDKIESENEVDALLESLILGVGSKGYKKISETESDTSSTDDILPSTSILDDEINDNDEDEDQTLNSTDFSSMADGDLDTEAFDTDDSVTEVLNEQNNIDDEQSLLLEESFTLHDDLDTSKEDAYTETLDVDYSDLKTDESHKFTSAMEGTFDDDANIESNDINVLGSELTDDLTEDNNKQNTDAEETLDTDLINFKLESNDTSDDGTADLEIDNSIESAAVGEPKEPFSSLMDDIDNHESIEIKNTDTDLEGDLDLDMDLDSLLKEVSGENSVVIDAIDEQELVIETSSPIIDTTIIDEDFNELDDGLNDDLDDELSTKNSPDFELQSLLNEVRDEADKNSKNNPEGLVSFNANGQAVKESAYEQTNAEKRWTQLCGNVSEIKVQKEVANISFTVNNHLLGALLRQISSTKDSEQVFRMKFNDLIIVIDSSENNIYCNLPVSSDEYAAICFAELNQLKIKIHDLDYSEVRLYRSKIKENPGRAHSIESFTWVTSLLTSQGRLPHDTNITKNIGLKVWPDLTRLELMPHAMHMAAVFSKHPGSLLELAKWLNIHQRYVFAFYNACLSLDMIEMDVSKIKKSSFSFGKKSADNKSEERGFFGRLLKRLKS